MLQYAVSCWQLQLLSWIGEDGFMSVGWLSYSCKQREREEKRSTRRKGRRRRGKKWVDILEKCGV